MLFGVDLYKLFVGAGISATLGLLGFMGNGIVNNEIRNVKQHTEIRREMVIGDRSALDRVDKVKDIVTDIRIEQNQQRVLLNDIKSKL